MLLADGELTEDASSDVRSHMSGCDSCRATYGELQKLEELLTPATGNPTMAEARFWRSFEADLALRVNRESTPFWRRAIVLPVPAAVAMSMAVVGLGYTVVQQRAETQRLSVQNEQLARVVEGKLSDVAVASSINHAMEVDKPSRDFKASFREFPAHWGTAGFQPRSVNGENRSATVEKKLPTVVATPRLEPGMQIQFVDSAESADFF